MAANKEVPGTEKPPIPESKVVPQIDQKGVQNTPNGVNICTKSPKWDPKVEVEAPRAVWVEKREVYGAKVSSILESKMVQKAGKTVMKNRWFFGHGSGVVFFMHFLPKMIPKSTPRDIKVDTKTLLGRKSG